MRRSYNDAFVLAVLAVTLCASSPAVAVIAPLGLTSPFLFLLS